MLTFSAWLQNLHLTSACRQFESLIPRVEQHRNRQVRASFTLLGDDYIHRYQLVCTFVRRMDKQYVICVVLDVAAPFEIVEFGGATFSRAFAIELGKYDEGNPKFLRCQFQSARIRTDFVNSVVMTPHTADELQVIDNYQADSLSPQFAN